MRWLIENYDPSWSPIFSSLSRELAGVDEALAALPKETVIYPPRDAVFRALQCVKPEDVKVVIIGQDPYHGEGEAMGLSFSVPSGVKIPPSLRNIFVERESDCGIPISDSGDLTSWAEQGVLLLNAILTVTADSAGSHRTFGWESVTDGIIRALSQQSKPIIFLLWGKFAEKKRKMIDESRHVVIASAHPSPLSAYRGFFGSAPFSQINSALEEAGSTPIDWRNQ